MARTQIESVFEKFQCCGGKEAKIYLEVLTKKSPILSSTYLRPWSSKPKIIIKFFLDISSQNKLLVIYNLKNQHFRFSF